MDYAVVKFTNETTESDSEVVSEVPVSWLTKNNTHCKWPSEKFASVYIAKKFDPKDDWEEFPIEVEYFCETLAEAKAKLKKKDKEETVGRGHRNIKPTDYFSPAEEDERNMKPKKKIDKKNTPDDTYESAVKFLNSFPQKQSSGTISPSSLENGNPLSVTPTGTSEETRSDGAFSIIPEDNLEGNMMTHVVIPESDVKQLVTKVDQVLGMIAGLQIDMAAIKEVIPELTKPPTGGSSDELSKSLPLTDLEELEQYNNELENKEQERKNFMKFLKSVGGHDAKDWTYRLMRSVMTDTLAEACSWTGRKSNYEIRNLKIFDLLYRVVNQKTACTAKDFTNYVAEWLRHAHTRKLRKDNKK